MSRKISISLSEASLDKAVKEMKDFKSWLDGKVKELLDRLVKEGETYAINEVGHIDTGKTMASIRGFRKGNKGVIVAGGNAIWIEFGTGIAYNGSAGGSPHPKGQELGMTIGTYGKGHGADTEGWWYEKDGEGWQHTFGIKANMFMYRTARELQRIAPSLAREVFSK